jgi:transportin-3
VQLSLALADLALQMPEWADVVEGMIEQFGKDPSTVSILLRFLKALVEEVGNPRLTVAGVSCKVGRRGRADEQDQDSIISAAAEPVIGVLSMYIQAPGMSTSD